MMAAHMAMGAVGNIGLPAAAGGAAGAAGALPGGRAAAEGPAGFGAALRAAAGPDPDGAGVRPAPGEKTPATIRKNGGPARATNSSEDAPTSANSAAGAAREAEPADAAATAAAAVSGPETERPGLLSRPPAPATGGPPDGAAGTALGPERIGPWGAAVNGGTSAGTREISADGRNPLRSDRCAAPPEAAAAAAGMTAMTAAAEEAAEGASAGHPSSAGEKARGGAAPEPLPLDGPAGGGAGEALEIRPGASSAGSDSRHAGEDSFLSRTAAAEAAASGEGEALPDGVESLARESRPPTAAEGGLERPTEVPAASRDKEALAGSGRAGVFDQIVQRASVQLRNEQSEINIDLKPDFLGRVRLQVLAENQQVSVRIFADLPAVRDMIETGLHWLKSELQSQGLQVERLEVAVADDHRQHGWPNAPHAPAWKPAAGALSGGEESAGEERSAAAYDHRSRSGGRTAVDMFV